MDRKMAPAAQPRGVTVFGVLIIASSLLHISKYAAGWRWYHQVLSYMPAWLIAVRYCFSWLQRLVGLAAGIGIMRRSDLARKALIAIAVFTILTVYWKHPLQGFVLHARYLDQQYADFLRQHEIRPDLFSSLAFYSMLANIVAEVIFDGVLIYYFTRPEVRRWFASKKGLVESRGN